jgi:RimJ/RimL family protein N-acetyltransferase
MTATLLPYPDPSLEDGVIRLRRWEGRDVACVKAAGEDPRIPSGTTVPPIYSEAEGMAFIKRQWGRQSDGEGLSLAIEEQATSTAVGLIALLFRPQPLVAGVGFWVIPEARGHRIASRAVALLSPWALHQTSIRRLEAFVDPENLASIRALESSGFQKEGLLRSYLNGSQDVLVYSLLPSDLGRRGGQAAVKA